MKSDISQTLSRAVFWMCVASLNFAVMSIAVKLLSPVFSAFECSLFRSGFGCVALVLILKQQKVSIFGSHRRELINRGLSGSVSVVFYFYAVSGGNLGETVSLIRTSALMIPFIALWTLSERIKLRHFLCAVTGFLGTMLIVKPGFQGFNSYTASAILSAVGGAFAWTSVRALANKEHPGTIIFYFYFISSLASIFAMIITGDSFTIPRPVDLGYIILLVTTGLLGQFGLVLAYRHAPAAVISPVNYTEIAFSACLAWMIFGQKIGLLSGIGILIICISAILIQDPVEAYRKWKQGRIVPAAADKITPTLV